MSAGPCRTPIGAAELMEYWLGESPAARESDLEEHLFACRACSNGLQAVVQLGDAIRGLFRQGATAAIFSPRFVDTLRKTGLQVREYELEPNSSVFCTIAPHDDLVFARLNASLTEVQRLDVLIQDLKANRSQRFEDVSFDAAQQAILLLPKARDLRQLGATTQRVRLIAVTDVGDRVLSEYVFNHTPHGA